MTVMNSTTVKKTISKFHSHNGPESVGFKRYIVLPQQVRLSLHTAHLVETGSTNAHDRIVSFFGGMSDVEYAAWLQFNGKDLKTV